MKKILTICSSGIFALLLVFTGVLFAGCGGGGQSANAQPKQTIAFAAVTAADFLGGGSGIQTLATQDEEKGILEKFLNTFEGLIKQGGLYDITVTDLEDPAYPNLNKKMEITKKDLLGNTQVITMYFVEVPKNPEDDSDIDEIESSLTGVLVIGNKTYNITATKEIEQGELEINLIARLEGDENHKVVFTQEIENGEHEYNYALFNGENLVTSTSFELEKEGDKTEIEFSFTLLGVTNYYEVESVTVEGKQFLNLKYKLTKDSTTSVYEINVEISENENGQKEYIFHYNNNN